MPLLTRKEIRAQVSTERIGFGEAVPSLGLTVGTLSPRADSGEGARQQRL